MRQVAGRLRLDLSQYRELEAFAQFGSELDQETQRTLARGERLVETLNQDELKPWALEDQVAAIYSGTGGYLDRIMSEEERQKEGRTSGEGDGEESEEAEEAEAAPVGGV